MGNLMYFQTQGNLDLDMHRYISDAGINGLHENVQ